MGNAGFEMESIRSSTWTANHVLHPAELQPDRPLYLAVPAEVYNGILSEPLGQLVMIGVNIRVVLFDPESQQVIRWIS